MQKKEKYFKKKRLLSKGIVLASVALIVIFLLGLYIFLSTVSFPSKVSFIRSLPPKAAIIDQGSFAPSAGPNPDFINEATAILKEAGYVVDYYPGEAVTVEFYRGLPTYGYKLIIERTHSGMIYPPREIPVSEYESYNFPKNGQLCLFTNEPFDPDAEMKYLDDLQRFRLVKCYYSDEDKKSGNSYLGLSPLFVAQSMRGKFNDTMILMMGCEGLKYDEMAKACVQKGCRVYISWNGLITSDQSDQATVNLLQNLLKKNSVKEAVIDTMRQIGPDSIYKSVMGFYPIEAGNYTL